MWFITGRSPNRRYYRGSIAVYRYVLISFSLVTTSLSKSYATAWSWNFGGFTASASFLQNNKRNSRKGAASSLQLELLDKAAQVRSKLGNRPPSYYRESQNSKNVLFFSSCYQRSENDGVRGFCNWLMPGQIMVGQYPGQTPEIDGPSEDEVRQHIKRLICDAHIRLFCSLQSEVPSQSDDIFWNKQNGMVFLEPESVRRRFPRPFTQYAPLVRELSKSDPASAESQFLFLHAPIEDLNVPESQEPLQKLLLELLNFLNKSDIQDEEEQDSPPGAIYLHCWGGRGRAGLVGACLLSLIWPTLEPAEVLDWVQTGYAGRLGHEQMPSGLSQSPQTSIQRAFVSQFVQEYQKLFKMQTKR